MESKLVSYQNLLASLLILSSVQQALGATCPYYGEPCNMVNWCCPGTECSNSYAGGTCVDDPFKSCKYEGQSCGFFDAKCCGKLDCTATFSGGECTQPNSYEVKLSNKMMGRIFE